MNAVDLKNIEALYKKINYRFENPQLLLQALRHRSYFLHSQEGRLLCNERLEFLGDAILSLIVSDYLYRKFPQKDEGDLTKLKSVLVSRELLAQRARKIGLGEFLFLGNGEENSGGRDRSSIISNAYEALIGAIYLDGGLQAVKEFVENQLLSDLEAIVATKLDTNFKSQLLELSQGRNWGEPLYSVKEERGPDHNKIFVVEVKVQGKTLGVGSGASKKKAEQMAAQQALEKLVPQELS